MIKLMTDPTAVDTYAKFAVLTRAFDKDGYEYIYLKGVASTVQYSPVVYDEAGVTCLADSAGTDPANDGPIAIAQGAVVADRWGWYMINGKTYVISAANATDNGQVYLTTTAGTVDVTDVAYAMVIGAWFRGAYTATGTKALVQIVYPVVHTAVAN